MKPHQPLKQLLRALTLLAALLVLGGCASTPQSRIQSNPEVFAQIPASQQAKAQVGEIVKGMGHEAVFIAWGKPSGVKNTSDGTETWLYAYSSPVYASGPYTGGWGYGRRCGWGGWIGPVVVAYETRIYAKVTFQNGQVTYWERLSGSR